MSRAFCIPGVIFLAIAFILNFLVSISLPFLPALDVARTHYPTGVQVENVMGVNEVRVSRSPSSSYPRRLTSISRVVWHLVQSLHSNHSLFANPFIGRLAFITRMVIVLVSKQASPRVYRLGSF